MMAHITGLGWVNAGGFGCGEQATFDPKSGALPEIARKDVFPEPYKRFGRLDEFSKIGLAAITFAIRDAGLEEWDEKRPIALIAETDYGCLGTDLNYFETVVPDGGKFASPGVFAYTLPNCFLGEAAIRFGLTGASYVINSSDRPGMSALQIGMDEIALNGAEAAIIGINNPTAPAGLGPDDRIPGALFMVLQPEATDSYGEFEYNGGQVAADTDEIPTLVEVAQALLEEE